MERLIVAWHEAGHAEAALWLGFKIRAVVLLDPADKFTAAVFDRIPENTPEQLRAKLVVCAAGGIAQRIRFPGIEETADIVDRCIMRQAAVKLLGLAASPEAIHNEITVADRRANRLVEQRWFAIESLAQNLLRFDRAVRGRPQFKGELDAALTRLDPEKGVCDGTIGGTVAPN
jgi:hypothetical protein